MTEDGLEFNLNDVVNNMDFFYADGGWYYKVKCTSGEERILSITTLIEMRIQGRLDKNMVLNDDGLKIKNKRVKLLLPEG